MWAELPDDIREELENPEYITRKHHSRATYALGCHGPLCQKAERDRGRERSESKTGDKYKPAPHHRKPDPHNVEDIIEWHIAELAERRASTKSA